MRRALAVPVAAALLVAPAAHAAAPTVPVYDAHGRVIRAPLAPSKPPVRLTQGRAAAIFLADPKVRDWLTRYPRTGRTTDAVYSAKYGNWTIKVWWGKAGEIATMRAGSSPRPGRDRRSPGRWHAATPARSAARRSTATRSGSGSARCS